MKYVKSILIYGLLNFCSTQGIFAQCDITLKTDSAEVLFDGTVNKFAVQGSTLYAGGNFKSVGQYSGSFIEINKKTGKPANRITWPKVNGPSNVIADGAGNYIVYGSFDSIDHISRQGLAIINSAGLLSSFNPNINGPINSVVIYGGVLYIGGYFTTVNGMARNHLAAINPSNGALQPWDPNVTSTDPLPCRIECMVQSGSQIYIGGAFSMVGNTPRKNIAVIDATIGIAGSWSPQAFFSASPNYGTVSKMLKTNNLLFVCGQFDFVGGKTHGDVAAIDLTTGVSTNWRPDPNSVVLSLANKGDTLYLGGAFFTISGLPRRGFAAYSIGSGSLLPIAIDTRKVVTENIKSILPVGDTLYLGGTFDTINNQERLNLAAFNRLTGAALPWKSHTNGDVTSLISDNGRLYAAGRFYSVGRKIAHFLAAIDLDADTALIWNARANAAVLSLNIQNNVLYIGGEFNKLNDSVRQYNAAWDLKTNKVLSWDPKANGLIKTVKKYKNDIYIGGEFDSISGQPHCAIAKLDAAGNVQPWIGIIKASNKDRVNTLDIYKDSLYAGGIFNNLGGQPATSLGAINLSTGLAVNFKTTGSDSIITIREVTATFLRNDTLIAAGEYIFVDTIIPTNPPDSIPVIANSIFRYKLKYTDGHPLIDKYTVPALKYNFPINDIVIESDNRMYAMGTFTNAYSGSPTADSYPLICMVNYPDVYSVSKFPYSNLKGTSVNAMYIYGNKMYLGGDLVDMVKEYQAVTLFYLPNTILSTNISTDTNSLCSGTEATVRANSSITYGATYKWFVNGSAINNPLSYYRSVPANKDSISCVVITQSNGCLQGWQDTTAAIVFNVTPTVTPDISISGPIEEEAGKAVTIKALVKDAATGYSIEWFNKGVSMGKTLVDSITYTKDSGTDSIYAVITPRTDTCYITDTSDIVKVEEQVVGIVAMQGDSKVVVYPNPFDTYVKVSGLETRDILILYDVTGRKVSTAIIASKEDYLLETGRLKTGVYVLKITDEHDSLRKTMLIQKQ